MMILIKEKCRKYIEERKTRQKRRVEKGIEEKKTETLEEEEPRCNRRKMYSKREERNNVCGRYRKKGHRIKN